ncbi:MAG: tetratricopeptide repeat protein [Deferribacteres bacterium]|nr:tetratricopeptide repeat protein [Deferribacteres bacterium]
MSHDEKPHKKKELADVIYEKRYPIIAAVVLAVLVVLGVGIYNHMKTKKAEKAAFLYSQGIKAYNQAERANSTKAESYLKEAVKYFDEAEKMDAGKMSVLAQLMKGRVLMDMGKKEEGIKEIKEGLSHLKDKSLFKNPFVCTTEDAKLLADRLSRNTPFLEAYLRYTYALALMKEGKSEKAKSVLKELIGKFPNSPFTLDAKKLMEVAE